MDKLMRNLSKPEYHRLVWALMLGLACGHFVYEGIKWGILWLMR